MSAAMARRWHAGPRAHPCRCDRPGSAPGLSCWFGVEPPAGIEPATPSLPWNHQEPLCGPPFPQVTPDRRGRSYRFSCGLVMRSLPSHVLIACGATYMTRWELTRLAISPAIGETVWCAGGAGAMIYPGWRRVGLHGFARQVRARPGGGRGSAVSDPGPVYVLEAGVGRLAMAYLKPPTGWKFVPRLNFAYRPTKGFWTLPLQISRMLGEGAMERPGARCRHHHGSPRPSNLALDRHRPRGHPQTSRLPGLCSERAEGSSDV
jgi:hypothetical protein